MCTLSTQHAHAFGRRWRFSTAQHSLRISELLAIEKRDVRFMPGGAVVTVRWAKNHRVPKHTVVHSTATFDAVKALAKAAHGKRAFDKLFPVTRSDYNKFVSRVARKICGLRATSHSLRAGWATDAFLSGMSEAEVMLHGRWRGAEALARYYYVPDLEDRLKTITTAFGRC